MIETCTLADLALGLCRTGCGRPAYCTGRCARCYQAHRRRTRAARCTVPDCTRPEDYGELCSLHVNRKRRHGDPAVVLIPAEKVNYSALHARVVRARGRASDHACVECGGPAQDWAYDDQDPAEIVRRRRRYSLDPARYEPKCHKCHMITDHRRRRERTAAA